MYSNENMSLTKKITNLNLGIDKYIKNLKRIFPLSSPLTKLNGSRLFKRDWTKGFKVIIARNKNLSQSFE